jgi:hypothetical protein
MTTTPDEPTDTHAAGDPAVVPGEEPASAAEPVDLPGTDPEAVPEEADEQPGQMPESTNPIVNA